MLIMSIRSIVGWLEISRTDRHENVNRDICVGLEYESHLQWAFPENPPFTIPQASKYMEIIEWFRMLWR
jgi:hypothetical protein